MVRGTDPDTEIVSQMGTEHLLTIVLENISNTNHVQIKSHVQLMSGANGIHGPRVLKRVVNPHGADSENVSTLVMESELNLSFVLMAILGDESWDISNLSRAQIYLHVQIGMIGHRGLHALRNVAMERNLKLDNADLDQKFSITANVLVLKGLLNIVTNIHAKTK